MQAEQYRDVDCTAERERRQYPGGRRDRCAEQDPLLDIKPYVSRFDCIEGATEDG